MSFQVIHKETVAQRNRRIDEAKKLLLEEYGTTRPNDENALEPARLLNELSKTIEGIEKDLTELRKLTERIKALV